MLVQKTKISGVYSVRTEVKMDPRGLFCRAFCASELSDILEKRNIKQINISLTHLRGAIRGVHYQLPPFAEMKLIRCIAGAVWDVVVDLRRDSQTFLFWLGFRLDSEENNMLVIPEGCAHGFQVLEEDSQLLYLHTEYYSSQHEGGLMYNDPRLSIHWPLPVTDISTRDLAHPLLDEAFKGMAI